MTLVLALLVRFNIRSGPLALGALFTRYCEIGAARLNDASPRFARPFQHSFRAGGIWGRINILQTWIILFQV